jgi:hypothetical protein
MREFFNAPPGMVLVCVAPVVLLAIVLCWLNARDTRRISRRWEMACQLRELEAQIYEESLPEEERARRRQFREAQAEVTREARRRLGLPEEDDG